MYSLEIEKLPEFDNHKFVTFLSDKKSGLRAFVAVHNDNLGPATGGTRMWVYPSETDALRDALALSRAMTYKCALAGVPYGGSKGVIIGDPHRDKTPQLLIAYAEAFNSLNGVTTGTDVGLTDEDVTLMRQHSKFILGAPNGDKLSTSAMATLGVFSGIEGCLESLYDSADMTGKKFAIKGLGKTGMELLKLLYERGAHVIAAEIDKEKIEYAKEHYPRLILVSPAVIHKQKVDGYCPCALRGDLNPKSVKELNCQFIIGTENNQLTAGEIGDWLHKSGILYIPDYVANAGGLIAVVDELEKSGYSKERVLKRVKGIKETVKKIILDAKNEHQATNRIADRLAKEIFTKKRVHPNGTS